MGIEKVHTVVSDQQQVSIRETKRGFEGRLRDLWGGSKNSTELVQHTAGRKKRHSPMRGLEPFQVVINSSRKAGKHCKIKKLYPESLAASDKASEKQTQATQGVGRLIYLSPNIEPSFPYLPILA